MNVHCTCAYIHVCMPMMASILFTIAHSLSSMSSLLCAYVGRTDRKAGIIKISREVDVDAEFDSLGRSRTFLITVWPVYNISLSCIHYMIM